MAVYFYYGDEDYNIELAIEALKKGLDKNFATVNFKKLYYPKFADLILAVRSQGIMFGKTLTVINCNRYFYGEDKEKAINFEDNELKELETALTNNVDGCDIAFYLNYPQDERKKIDKRKKIFKVLSKFNSQEFLRFQMNYYGKQDLSAWIKKDGKAKGITLEQPAIDELIESVGNHLRELDYELDKLKLFAYPEKTITKAMVKEICISNEDLFQFTELVMSQDYDKALFEYKKLLDKKHPLEILSAIQTILRKRILLKINSNKSVEEIASITGMSAKQVTAIMRNSHGQHLKNLVKLKENLTNAEYNIKSGKTINAAMEVQNALLR